MHFEGSNLKKIKVKCAKNGNLIQYCFFFSVFSLGQAAFVPILVYKTPRSQYWCLTLPTGGEYFLFAHCANVMPSADPTWLTVDWTGLESVPSDAILRLLVLVCSVPPHQHNCAALPAVLCTELYSSVLHTFTAAGCGWEGLHRPALLFTVHCSKHPKNQYSAFSSDCGGVWQCGEAARAPAGPARRPPAKNWGTETQKLR